MYALKINIRYDEALDTYRIAATCVESDKSKVRVICKPGFESARLAEQDIPAFMERQNFNIRPLKGIFDLEGRSICNNKLPKEADAITIPLKISRISRIAFNRAKKQTGWDLLSVHDWIYDPDLKGINKYEDLMALSRATIRSLRRLYCTNPRLEDEPSSSKRG